MKDLWMVVDLQYGSTGKGLICGHLALKWKPDTIVTAWGPNAGHTYVDSMGRKRVNIALPSGLTSPSVRQVLIGPGSIINPDIMMAEINEYLPEDVGLAIHENAAVVTEAHRELEAQYGYGIGSTMKGVGEAIMHKISRQAPYNIARERLLGTPLEGYLVSAPEYNNLLDRAALIQVEGAQGFSLSINQGFYPYVTSRECTVHQVLSDCSIPWNWAARTKVIGVARTFPIRVANRVNSKGEQIGWSGPCYQDQDEITWESIGLEPELTTVTKLPRRIFTFSEQQIWEACRMNNPNWVFLNFCNYLQARGQVTIDSHLAQIMDSINQASRVRWLGWGPGESDVEEIG